MAGVPVNPIGPPPRWIGALLALTAWCGVLLQLWLSIRLAQANGKTALDGLVVYLGYFTILTNLFVAVVSTAALAVRRGPRLRPLASPSLAGCATASILLVGIAYHFLLRHIWAPQGLQWVADAVLHYAVPALALLHWLLRRDAGRLPAWAPLAWCAWPAAYLTYALLRGEWLGSYPYPFIDVTTLGHAQVLRNALGLLAGFLLLGYLVLGVARWRAASTR